MIIDGGEDIHLSELRALFDAQLARFNHPRPIAMLEALPKTTLGKVQRAGVRAMLGAH